MEYGIQRRTIYLVPPEGEDLSWMFDQFDRAEIWRMFGFGRGAKLKIMRAYRMGHLVVGLIRLVATRKRIGFVVMFPPAGSFDFWELGYAIPDPADRDGFSALNATDAMAHYMFEHLRVDALGWRTHEENRSADAVVRRLGYQPFETCFVDGANFTFYRLDRDGWARRRARLDRGEAQHPSGVGATFTMLEAPYQPILPKSEGASRAISPLRDPPETE